MSNIIQDLHPKAVYHGFNYTGEKVNYANGVAIRFFSMLTTVMALVPLISLIKIRQVGPCSLILISMVFSIFAMISSIIWDDENQDQWYNGAGFCHINAPLRQPLTIAFALAMVLMPWKLVETLRSRSIVQSNRVWWEILFVWGLPLLFILPFQYLVMANVYSIVPGFGCAPEFDYSWLSFIIVFMWWPLLLFLTFILSIIMGVMIHRKREEISCSLSDESSRASQRTFIKLYVLATIIIAIYFPVQLIFIIRFLPTSYESYKFTPKTKAWATPSFYHTSNDPQIQYQPWAYITINLLMFLFYGANDDAQKLYKKCMHKMGLAKLFPVSHNLQTCSSRSKILSHVDLVGYVTRKFEKSKTKGAAKHFTSLKMQYSQDSSINTRSSSFHSNEYMNYPMTAPRTRHFGFLGSFRTIYNLRWPSSEETRDHTMSQPSDSISTGSSYVFPSRNIELS
ncbi:hypothetical protein K3495_g5823 [Podosphaera aphanis]|nr:hypothetical protein K3495_g5823 [Podosphaera aphanis]